MSVFGFHTLVISVARLVLGISIFLWFQVRFNFVYSNLYMLSYACLYIQSCIIWTVNTSVRFLSLTFPSFCSLIHFCYFSPLFSYYSAYLFLYENLLPVSFSQCSFFNFNTNGLVSYVSLCNIAVFQLFFWYPYSMKAVFPYLHFVFICFLNNDVLFHILSENFFIFRVPSSSSAAFSLLSLIIS